MINPYEHGEGQYIPIFKTQFGHPIEILERVDKNGHVVRWEFLQNDVIDANHGKKYFNVGELVLDFFNHSVEILKYYDKNGCFPSGQTSPHVSPQECKAERDTIIYLLSEAKEDIAEMTVLYSGFVKMHKDFNCKVEIEPYGIGVLDRAYGLVPGNKYKVYGELQFSFLSFDFYHIINNPQLCFSKCKYCEHIFIQDEKNQKYCSDCRKNHIPEKEKKKNNPSYRLKQTIYNRLYARSKSGNNRDYCSNLKNHYDFSELAKEKKSLLSSHEYYAWLQQIDALTK